MKLSKVLASSVPIALMGLSLGANAYLIDPDGAGGDAAINVSLLDWNVGNLRVNCTSGCTSPSNIVVGDTLQSYAHSDLSAFNNASDTAGTSLGTDYEWTFRAGFQEAVALSTGGVPGVASFVNIAGADNFFEIWYDPGQDANQLEGGETMNNGTLILSGTVLPFDPVSGVGGGNFGASANGVDLDQFGANNYDQTTSIAGFGGGTLAVDVDFFDSLFFVGGSLPVFELNFTTSQTLAFNEANPSSCFVAGTGGGMTVIDGAGVPTSGTGGSCQASAIGSLNGDPGEASVATIFQADANTSFPVPVPAPVSLLGLGLVLLGLNKRKSKG